MVFNYGTECKDLVYNVLGYRPADVQEAVELLEQARACKSLSDVVNNALESGVDIINADIVSLVLDEMVANTECELLELGCEVEFGTYYNYLDYHLSLDERSRENLESTFSDDIGGELWFALSDEAKMVLRIANYEPYDDEVDYD